jgi:hypothetical protein
MSSVRLRYRVITMAAAAGLVLAGCAQTVNGTGTRGNGPVPGGSASAPHGFPTSAPATVPGPSSPPASTPATNASSGGSTAPISGGFPTSAGALADFMANGSKSISSAHLSLDETVATEKITASGDEELTNGKTTAMDLSLSLPGLGEMREIIVNGKIYVHLPGALGGTKPWTLASANSTNPAISQLYTSLQQTTQSGSFAQVALFLQVATKLNFEGTTTIGGAAAGHYSLTIDLTKLPASFPDKSAMVASGLTSIPIELWVDPQGRLLQMVEKVTVQGQTVDVTVGLSKLNVPVTISPPPANEVGH